MQNNGGPQNRDQPVSGLHSFCPAFFRMPGFVFRDFPMCPDIRGECFEQRMQLKTAVKSLDRRFGRTLQPGNSPAPAFEFRLWCLVRLPSKGWGTSSSPVALRNRTEFLRMESRGLAVAAAAADSHEPNLFYPSRPNL
jgi:hypothetical protein